MVYVWENDFSCLDLLFFCIYKVNNLKSDIILHSTFIIADN